VEIQAAVQLRDVAGEAPAADVDGADVSRPSRKSATQPITTIESSQYPELDRRAVPLTLG
jgi:hypothetical protein